MGTPDQIASANSSKDEPDSILTESRLHRATPARIFVDRSGVSYRTATWLELRRDHAAAADAVQEELDLERDLGSSLISQHQLFVVQTRASSKREYLARPEHGRDFSDESRQQVVAQCPPGCDLQIAIGDGLSVAAVRAQVPLLLPRLEALAIARGWRRGQILAIRYCRVGILNAIGDALGPRVVVLLIGERPGLATAESLSAYLAYQPRHGHTDARRNLISNIHSRGVPPEEAAERIIGLAEQLMELRTSGVEVKERLPGARPISFSATRVGLD